MDFSSITSKPSTFKMFKKYLEFCNSEISKAVLSQTLTTEVVDKGSYAASNTHAWVMKQIFKADKRLVEKAVNRLLTTVIRLNFVEKHKLPNFEMYDTGDFKQIMHSQLIGNKQQ